VRRTGLLHDIGKLGVSNMILDKPAKLTEAEFAELKKHPAFTEQIIGRVAGMSDLAETAAAHHEKLNGRGYHRGVASGTLPLAARLLAVADVFEALTAARPYRAGLPIDQVLEMMRADVGTSLCGDAFAGLEAWLDRRAFAARVDTQLAAVEELVRSL
jgi:HD-GYP domain-containing protein (c-di-GMP phosphodiesterase class II)